jgi:hypothetical protein
MHKDVTICDCCGKTRPVGRLHIPVDWQRGPDSREHVLEDVDLCLPCMTEALQEITPNDPPAGSQWSEKWTAYKREHPQEATR